MTNERADVIEMRDWQRENQLEAGRNEVLREAARGADLSHILNLLCEKSEQYNQDMKCSVLLLNEENSTLHPVASVSLPEDYCQALDGVTIGLGVGSCGTAAFSKERVIVEDINTHPFWAQYKGLALGAGLQACWSEPIIGPNGRVFGTFAMYYETPRKPTQDDLHFIETSANLAAVVFESCLARTELIEANRLLAQTVDERNQQLMDANKELSGYLEQKTIENIENVNLEKSQTTKMLLMGFAHEVNTPVGIALTASSYSTDMIQKFINDVNSGKLTKLSALEQLNALKESVSLGFKNLIRTSQLIGKFKEIDTSSWENYEQKFLLSEFFLDLQNEVKGLSENVDFKFEAEPGLETHSQMAMLQVFNQLIENSITHGFQQYGKGSISIHATATEKEIEINYQDDGRGLPDDLKEKVFEPFFSTQRNSGSIGLGLSVVKNVIADLYKGDMKLIDSPVGIRYRIRIPR